MFIFPLYRQSIWTDISKNNKLEKETIYKSYLQFFLICFIGIMMFLYLSFLLCCILGLLDSSLIKFELVFGSLVFMVREVNIFFHKHSISQVANHFFFIRIIYFVSVGYSLLNSHTKPTNILFCNFLSYLRQNHIHCIFCKSIILMYLSKIILFNTQKAQSK